MSLWKGVWRCGVTKDYTFPSTCIPFREQVKYYGFYMADLGSTISWPYHPNNTWKLAHKLYWTQPAMNTTCTEHSLPAAQFLTLQTIATAVTQMCRSCGGETWIPEPPKRFFPDMRLTHMYGGRLKLSILPRNLYTWREIFIIFPDYINHLFFLVLLKWVIMKSI